MVWYIFATCDFPFVSIIRAELESYFTLFLEKLACKDKESRFAHFQPIIQ